LKQRQSLLTGPTTPTLQRLPAWHSIGLASSVHHHFVAFFVQLGKLIILKNSVERASDDYTAERYSDSNK